MSVGPDPDLVCEIARNLLGSVALSVRRIDEGGDFSSWMLGDHAVARFALNAASGKRLRREVLVRDAIRVGMPVSIPRMIATATWRGSLPVVIDQRLLGISSEDLAVGKYGENQLSLALTTLGSLETSKFRQLGVPSQRPWNFENMRRQAIKEFHTLDMKDHDFSDLIRIPESAPPGMVLTHSDIKGEHILVNNQGRIAALLDWADTAVADPATDIAGLAIALGSGAATRIGNQAGYSDQTCRLGLFVARCGSIIRLASQLRNQNQGQEQLLRRQLMRAIGLTALD